MKNTRKISLFALGFIFLFGYGFLVVQAAYPATQLEPGESLDPGLANPACTPGSPNCSVSTAWDMDLTSGYIFNTTELVGIGTPTPTATLDVVGDTLLTYTDTGGTVSTAFANGQLAPNVYGSVISSNLVSNPNAVFAYNVTGFNNGVPFATMSVQDTVSDLQIELDSTDSEVQLEAGDLGTGSNSYLELHTNGEINLNSNPDANISAALDFDDDGTVNLFSNTDIALGVSSGITLNGPSALYPGSLSAYATNANDIGAYFALDPDFLTSIGVDDQDGDGSYSMTLSPNYGTGIVISHTDTTFGLVDVGTFYLGGVDAGFQSVIDRVITAAVPDVSIIPEPDFIMNQWALSTGGISFSYQTGQGSLSQSAEGALSINNNFDWTGDTASFAVDTGTLDLDADFAWVGDIATFAVTGGDLGLTNDFNWQGDSSKFDATRAVSNGDGIVNVNEFNTDLTTLATITDTSYRGLTSILTYTGDDDMSGMSAVASQPLVGILSQVESIGDGDVGMQGLLATVSQSGDGVITQEMVGGQFVTYYSGDGSSDSVTGARFSTYNGIGVVPNLGDVDSLRGINTTTIHGSTGTTSFAYGIATNLRIENAGGLISNAYGNDVKIIAEAGQIQQATNIKLNSLIDTGTIDNATGIEFNAGTYDGDIPGLFSTGTTIGISFQDYNAEAALKGDNVYGIYFNDVGSLQGSTSEYALYIGDTNAENWFSDGLRIGTDDDLYKISANGLTNSDGSGVAIGGAGTLYIGTNTIDTTAPSDERTKENISDTQYGLEELVDINIVDFTYDQTIIDDGSEQHTGVLAQQVESIYPEAISRRSDGFLMVNYKTFIPLIMRAVQELRTDVVGMLTNFVTDTLRARRATVTEEFCVGATCVNESEFAEIVNQIRDGGNVGGGSDQGDDGDVGGDDSDGGGQGDEEQDNGDDFDIPPPTGGEEDGGSSGDEGSSPDDGEGDIGGEDSGGDIGDTGGDSEAPPEGDVGGGDTGGGTEGGETPII